MNAKNTTNHSKNSQSFSPGSSGGTRIGLKKNLKMDSDSRKSKETNELNKIIDMAVALETPHHQRDESNPPESSMPESNLLDSIKAN